VPRVVAGCTRRNGHDALRVADGRLQRFLHCDAWTCKQACVLPDVERLRCRTGTRHGTTILLHCYYPVGGAMPHSGVTMPYRTAHSWNVIRSMFDHSGGVLPLPFSVRAYISRLLCLHSGRETPLYYACRTVIVPSRCLWVAMG